MSELELFEKQLPEVAEILQNLKKCSIECLGRIRKRAENEIDEIGTDGVDICVSLINLIIKEKQEKAK